MPIAEIINQIDAYLAQLRQARELLSGEITQLPQKGIPRRKRKVLIARAKSAPSSTPRAGKNKSPSNRPGAHLKEVRTQVDPGPQPVSAVTGNSSLSERAPTVEPQNPLPHNVVIQRLPPRRPARSSKSVRPRNSKPAAGAKPDAVKPAIALAGPANRGIVVVSAQQVQQERERLVTPEIRPRRIPASGLSGRRAFEALFKDEIDPSKAPGQ